VGPGGAGCAGDRGRMIHVEIVLVAPDLDVHLQIARRAPAVAAAARPDTQLIEPAEILKPRREAEERLGATVDGERARLDPKGALVDLRERSLKLRVARVGFVAHAGRRLIDDGGTRVRGTDRRRDDET